MFMSVFIKSGEMSGNTGMQTWNDCVEDLFFIAEFLLKGGFKTVLFIDQLPNITTIVVGERLYISVNIEVLPFIVSHVLDMPHPTVASTVPLRSPQLLSFLHMRAHAISTAPKERDIIFTATTNGAAFTFAHFKEEINGAFLINIKPNDSKILGLNKLIERPDRALIHFPHWVDLKPLQRKQ